MKDNLNLIKRGRVNADHCFIAISRCAGSGLSTLFAKPDMRFADMRALFVGIVNEAKIAPESLRTYDPPVPVRNGSGELLAHFRLCGNVRNVDYTGPIILRCRLVADSPAHWQRYTLIIDEVKV